MSQLKLPEIPTYTVVCRWTGTSQLPADTTFAVVIAHTHDPQSAAADAILALVKLRGGEASALFVIEGAPKIHLVDDNWYERTEGMTYLGIIPDPVLIRPLRKGACPVCGSLMTRTLTWRCCGSNDTSQGCWSCGYVTYPKGINEQNWKALMAQHTIDTSQVRHVGWRYDYNVPRAVWDSPAFGLFILVPPASNNGASFKAIRYPEYIKLDPKEDALIFNQVFIPHV